MAMKKLFWQLFVVVQVAWLLFFFVFSAGLFRWVWFLGLGLHFATLVAWTILSWWNIVDRDEVAMRQWFGQIEKRRFTSGLCFVPWFPGIKLVRISKKMQWHLFEKDQDPKVPGNILSGTMFAVRSKDGQKMFVEATVFNRFPYDLEDSLILLLESGVPIDDKEELRGYIEDAIADDLNYVFGQWNYAEVMGGRRNEELNGEINGLLQRDGSLLRSVGFFGDDAKVDDPGTGEFYLRIEFVHLTGELGAKLELVETAKLEARAAKSVAKNKAAVIGGPLEIMLERWVQKELERSGVDLTDASAVAATKKSIIESGDYVEAEKAFLKLRSQDLAGGGTYNKEEIDINSGGEPLKDSNIAAIIGTIAGAAAAWGAATGGGKGSRKRGGGGGGKSVEERMRESREKYEREQKEGKK